MYAYNRWTWNDGVADGCNYDGSKLGALCFGFCDMYFKALAKILGDLEDAQMLWQWGK